MAKNLSGSQVGMSPANDINNPQPHNYRGMNQFPQSYKFLATDQYGVYSPFFWAKCERGDIQNLGSEHDLHTYTMETPMVSDVTMTKSYIKVPMQAIYPRNWKRMFTIPTTGSDVPSDCRALLDISRLVSSLLVFLYDNAASDSSFDNRRVMRVMWLLELLCSHGSLFERFNMHLNYTFEWTDQDDNVYTGSIDKFLDTVYYPRLIDLGRNNPILNKDIQYYVRDTDDQPYNGSVRYVSDRRWLEILRDADTSLEDFWSGFGIEFSNLLRSLNVSTGYSSLAKPTEPSNLRYLNIEPIISYALACVQFGSNDHVDYQYSAEIYRDNLQSLFSSALSYDNEDVFPTYLYNGSKYQYDVFSERVFTRLIFVIEDQFETMGDAIEFFINIFEYWRSLRFGDYFTGSKPAPLAIGDYDVEVVDDSVSTLEMVKQLQLTRLGHHALMTGPKYDDYLAGIYGGQLPEADKDVPIFLAHQYFNIEGFETNNTGDAQLNPDYPNTITTHLRSSESKHAFEVTISEPCYIIGMNSYVSHRIYSRTMDRFAFHHDRYDDFIPEMQYIGDQDIKLVEIDSSDNVGQTAFAYATRFMEYKQRVSYASGGFIEHLPSWAFITDNRDGAAPDYSIDPDYIRSVPSEFDRFYKSLTGYSLGSYFHFIVAHSNYTAPIRRMDYQPEILK